MRIVTLPDGAPSCCRNPGILRSLSHYASLECPGGKFHKPNIDTMKLHLYLLTALLGIVLTVHLGMNAKVGAAMNNPRVANALFWCIGAVTAVIIGLTGWKTGAFAGLKDVSPIMLTAGAIGACLVFGIAWLFPQLGGAPVMLLLLAGQVFAGLLISHFGWLGSPIQPMTAMKVIGALVMFGGVALVTYSK